jgi:ribose-phosphate pyrophosphokinase
MIDTAGTLCEAAKTLKDFGALSVSCFATHGLFSGNALNNIKNSKLEKIIVTNTTPKKIGEESIDKITRLSVGFVFFFSNFCFFFFLFIFFFFIYIYSSTFS